MEQKQKANKRVNTITNNIHMIFRPKTLLKSEQKSPPEKLLTRLKRMFSRKDKVEKEAGAHE